MENFGENNLATEFQRLKFARLLTRLDRREFAKKYNLSEASLRSWENGDVPHITLNAINKCVKALRSEGIIVAPNWIRFGESQKPKLLSPIKVNNFTEEIGVYNMLHPNSISLHIKDDFMLPDYKKGDFVMGRPIYENFEVMDGAKCIIILEDKTLLLRQLILNENGLYNLWCTNGKISDPKLNKFNILPKAVAKIFLHRVPGG